MSERLSELSDDHPFMGTGLVNGNNGNNADPDIDAALLDEEDEEGQEVAVVAPPPGNNGNGGNGNGNNGNDTDNSLQALGLNTAVEAAGFEISI